jgi:plasmid stabilization system protein ParE
LSYRIVWSESALERMEEILDFLEDAPAARRVAADLSSRIQALAEHPRLGRPLDDEVEPDLRRLVLGDCVLVYRIEERTKTVSIAAVRHFRQRSLRGEEL